MLWAGLAAMLAAQAGFAQDAGAPAVQPAPRSAPRPTNANIWVAITDYPAEALEKRQEGAVGFTLAVAAGGHVTGCSISTSSGAPSLDTTTCALLFRRARFEPATDAAGTAVAGTFSSRLRWVYPAKIETAAAPATAPTAIEVGGRMRYGSGQSILKVGTDGIITNCDYGISPYSNRVPLPSVCGLFPVGARYGPPATSGGRPIKRKITLDVSVSDVNIP